MVRYVEIIECVVARDAHGFAHQTFRTTSSLRREIRAQGVDEALTKAEELVLADGHKLRALNMKPDGNLRAVVWAKGSEPKAQQVPGYIWKKPPGS